VGVNAAVFSIVHGVLLKKLAVEDPDRIVQLRAGLKQFESAGFSYPVFQEIARRTEIFTDVIAFQSRPLAVVLVFTASLFARSLWNLKHVDLGFDIERVLTIELERPSVKKGPPSAAQMQLAQLLHAVRESGRVESAALSVPGFLTGGMMSADAKALDAPTSRPVANVHVLFASPGFLETLRIQLRNGRDFNEADRANAPAVVLINERLAQLLWPGQDPIGRHAQRQTILWLFAREAAVLLAFAVLLGAPLALLLGRYAGKMLYGIRPSDPATLVGTLLVILAGGMFATLVPARRATAINPVDALRSE
jgi:MacB-like periplasmic core domain